MALKVDLIDLGMGNTRSVANWLEVAGCHVKKVKHPEELTADLIVMPGVGAAGRFMDKLVGSEFDQAISQHVREGGRLLGICLGFQLLMEHTDEDGGVYGLGLLKGRVENLPNGMPHNQWENMDIDFRSIPLADKWNKAKLTKSKLYHGRVFYNHEYGVINNSKDQYAIPVSDELKEFSALIIKGGIIGMQFHPEKSQISGAKLLNIIL